MFTGADELLVVSPMVLTEVDYLLYDRFGAAAARRFAREVAAGGMELAVWSGTDHGNALDVTEQYGDDYIGIADAGNVVLADRYRTTRLLTLDQRHFRVLKPLWGADHFTLLPNDHQEPR